jgi:hypothetical protein
MNVRWEKFKYYTTSSELNMMNGEGVLINFIEINGDAMGVVCNSKTKAFVLIPRIYLEAVK